MTLKEESKQELERGITIIHKQETLEEAAKHYSENWEEITGLDYGNLCSYDVQELDFKNGAKWQAERMYSEEEVKKQLNLILAMKNSILDTFTDDEGFITDKWFNQFKKK